MTSLAIKFDDHAIDVSFTQTAFGDLLVMALVYIGRAWMRILLLKL